MYCVAPLPLTEESARLRKPLLRPPEKHQLGYNNILLPTDQTVPEEVITETATFLKLTPEKFQEILSSGLPLPVARTASRAEAELVFQRLSVFGFKSLTLSDDDLGLSLSDNSAVRRVRSMGFDDRYLTIFLAGSTEETTVSWDEVVLILPGWLVETRLEIKERKTRKTENEILDTSEFFRDEAVFDFYTTGHSSTWRVSAHGFDFSCLEKEKTLIANENITRLQRLIASKAVKAQFDDSYKRVRQVLECAWATQPETQSSGWRRERPGKLSVGMATTKSNESQFTRYSRLRYYLHKQS